MIMGTWDNFFVITHFEGVFCVFFKLLSKILENQLCNDNIRSQLFCKPFCLVCLKLGCQNTCPINITRTVYFHCFVVAVAGMEKGNIYIWQLGTFLCAHTNYRVCYDCNRQLSVRVAHSSMIPLCCRELGLKRLKFRTRPLWRLWP